MISEPVAVDPASAALFLDVDGTLVHIQDRPEKVVSPPALAELLSLAQDRLEGALALISGRTITELDRIFAPRRFPAAGGHGVEYRLPGGDIEFHSELGIPARVLERLEDVVGRYDGTFIETKNHGVTLHYRQNPAAASALREAVEAAAGELGEHFGILCGKMVYELVPRGYDKGAAIRFFLEHDPFAGRRPVFIGDDVTDEAGFATVNSLGGVSVRVGDKADSHARWTIGDVDAVHDWLRNRFATRGPARAS